MSDLTGFLLARIADDESSANRHSSTLVSVLRPWTHESCDEVHVHPGRVLAQCAATRRVIDLAVSADDDARATGGAAWGDDILRALALPYSDHPDYRDEWRP